MSTPGGPLDDPFEIVVIDDDGDFSALSRRPVAPARQSIEALAPAPAAALTATLHGFGLDEQPLLTGLPGVPGETVSARTTVPLLKAHVGASVVVLCEQGDPRRPIVVGVLQESMAVRAAVHSPDVLAVQVDGDRMVLTAEREIVLRCGDASITLTRAGKVLIKGTYVLSRSSGYNRIKGAAVDIN